MELMLPQRSNSTTSSSISPAGFCQCSRNLGPKRLRATRRRFISLTSWTFQCFIFIFLVATPASQVFGARLLRTTPFQANRIRQAEKILDAHLEAEKQKAGLELSKICSNPLEFPYLACQKIDDHEYHTHFGRGGGGVRASLINDGSVRIYENCASDQTNLTLPALAPGCLLDPQVNPRVSVFMKVLLDSAETRNVEHSSQKEVSALSKEITRSRFAAVSKVNGVPIGPAFYDLVDANNKWHSIHNRAFFQGLVDGNTTHQLILDLLRSAKISYVFDIERVVLRFQEFRRAQGEGDAAKTATAWEAVTAAMDRTNNELWLRFRLIISVMNVVFQRAAELWTAGVFHCDMHSANIMHLLSYETDPSEVLQMLKSGEGFVPSVNLYYSQETLSKTAAEQMDKVHPNGLRGLPVIRFKRNLIRYIDNGMLLILDPAKTVNVPCKDFRPAAQEDLNELVRTVVNNALNHEMYAFPELDKIQDAESVLNDGAGKSVLDAIKQNWQRLEDVREDLLTDIRLVMELARCKAVVGPARMGLKTQLHLECTNNQMREGLRKMMMIMKEAASTFPVPVYFEPSPSP